MTTESSKVGYQFTPMPKQLTHLLDVNLRSMLFSLIDISNYFADEDGWFFRTNDQLHLDSDLSKNVVIATIDTLFQHNLVDVSCTGTGKGKTPNNYRLNLDSFKFFEQLDMNTDLHRPENKIETIKYNVKGYHATYLDDQPVRYIPELVKGKITWNPVNPTGASTTDNTTVPTTEPTNELTTDVTKIEHNIDNIDSIYNKEYKDNIEDINNIENVNIDYIKTYNNILKEKMDIEKEKLERIMEEGVSEPMTRNEEEGKENPNGSQSLNINPNGGSQDSITSDFQAKDGSTDSSSECQSYEKEPQQGQHNVSSETYKTKSLQEMVQEEFREFKKDIAPELDKLEVCSTRDEFSAAVKQFYQYLDQKLDESNFSHEAVRKQVEFYVNNTIDRMESRQFWH